MSMEPDELYTLRAQYWLGHYQLALDEAKGIMRRPMSPELKLEREEYVGRCHLALGDYSKVITLGQQVNQTPAIVALGLKAQYEQYLQTNKITTTAMDDPTCQNILQQLQLMCVSQGGEEVNSNVQLYAGQVFVMAGNLKDAFNCGIHLGVTMEHISLCLQIYIMMDRLDLAKNQLSMLRQIDEDSVLTQLGSIHISLATGSSMSDDAIHTLQQLSEQYGPSTFLLNLMSCAYMSKGNYNDAELKLEQIRQELGNTTNIDTIVNLIVCYQYQQKPTDTLVQQLITSYPNHFLAKGLDMVEGAFEREALKYKV